MNGLRCETNLPPKVLPFGTGTFRNHASSDVVRSPAAVGTDLTLHPSSNRSLRSTARRTLTSKGKWSVPFSFFKKDHTQLPPRRLVKLFQRMDFFFVHIHVHIGARTRSGTGNMSHLLRRSTGGERLILIPFPTDSNFSNFELVVVVVYLFSHDCVQRLYHGNTYHRLTDPRG